MGRAPAFQRDDAVRAAREVFWRQGYENAALLDLERATGLNRSSIYHAFGSKRGLFDAAVDCYLDEVVRPRLSDLSAPSVGGGALPGYLQGLRQALAEASAPDGAHGCLLLNAAASPIVRDDAVREVVAAYHRELRQAVGRGVAARFPERAAADCERLATQLTALVIAALALVRVDREGAVAIMDAGIELIR